MTMMYLHPPSPEIIIVGFIGFLCICISVALADLWSKK